MKDNVRRINADYTYNSRIGASDVYRKFKMAFEAFFNPNGIARNKKEFEAVYVHDKEFEKKLEEFRNSAGSMASFCIGYTGIGKTTTIRYCFGLGTKNVPVYNEERKELVFPAFFDGHNETEVDYAEDLAKKIGAVCRFLEYKHPDLKKYLKTDEGLKDFIEFIQETKPEIIEVNRMSVLEMSEKEEIKYRLNHAAEKHTYSYNAILLKFMISKKYEKYERLIIILDDVESLPHDYQQNLMRLYLSLFDCMKNTEFPETSEYNVNLLISVRPHTYRLFNNNRSIETYPLHGTPITKDKAIDLSDLFQRRFDYYTKDSKKTVGNLESWKECYAELKNMNEMFDGKYKDMIINLCYLNIREALSYYAKIFANRLWVQKNKEMHAEFVVNSSDFVFNNITIIRAIACNENKVYFNDTNNILPCLFLTTDKSDESIYCLLLLQMFFRKRNRDEYYGLGAKDKKLVMENIASVFKDEEIVEKFEEALIYLFEKRILRKSIRDKDDYKTLDRKESLKDDSMLYLSSKGTEMWKMFCQDSVLLELFREEVYRDYTKNNFNDQSSFELMGKGQQKEIFLDLLEYIAYLGYAEDDLLNKIEGETRKQKYISLFGSNRVVTHLLSGVESSLRYSGKMGDEQLKERFVELQQCFNL